MPARSYVNGNRASIRPATQGRAMHTQQSAGCRKREKGWLLIIFHDLSITIVPPQSLWGRTAPNIPAKARVPQSSKQLLRNCSRAIEKTREIRKKEKRLKNLSVLSVVSFDKSNRIKGTSICPSIQMAQHHHTNSAIVLQIPPQTIVI